ncbi:peroxisomal membrane anchor protein conserved region-domain-containing protein [Halteromyces radiatus]|uniref:peroxisomal membrane anchor protein conserved region-domain-containing protein n=1 Tax=Halteromyces radiatus TaxID=101107 RepID=UPI00221EF8DB|nr:peroxisomal membrane anchor protein conserved region-domain-containing protein [Halteromyces radiatus]KAI8099150.1 peroxisomal membrane anchor protein conserved region-domain-containing protein [Halteromyces radiatus]
MREDLISSAINFLNDPKVQSAPLAKKVSFLESKGMTSEEIEEAMARVNGKAPSSSTTTTVNPGQYTQPNGMVLQTTPPPVPTRPRYDWRDLFIAAVFAGGIGYGVWTLAKNVFGPWFKVPTQVELEEDKEMLDAQFQAVEDSLKEIKTQTNEALTSVSEQSKKVEESLASLETVLNDLKEGDQQRDEEFKTVKEEVESLKELVPKMLDRNKEAQGAVLNDLQNEIKSLKSLLLSRRSPGASLLEQGSSNTTSSSPAVSASTTNTDGLSPRLSAAFNSSSSRPGIPAWQMASANKSSPSTESKTNESTTTAETASSSSSS